MTSGPSAIEASDERGLPALWRALVSIIAAVALVFAFTSLAIHGQAPSNWPPLLEWGFAFHLFVAMLFVGLALWIAWFARHWLGVEAVALLLALLGLRSVPNQTDAFREAWRQFLRTTGPVADALSHLPYLLQGSATFAASLALVLVATRIVRPLEPGEIRMPLFAKAQPTDARALATWRFVLIWSIGTLALIAVYWRQLPLIKLPQTIIMLLGLTAAGIAIARTLTATIRWLRRNRTKQNSAPRARAIPLVWWWIVSPVLLMIVGYLGDEKITKYNGPRIGNVSDVFWDSLPSRPYQIATASFTLILVGLVWRYFRATWAAAPWLLWCVATAFTARWVASDWSEGSAMVESVAQSGLQISWEVLCYPAALALLAIAYRGSTVTQRARANWVALGLGLATILWLLLFLWGQIRLFSCSGMQVMRLPWLCMNDVYIYLLMFDVRYVVLGLCLAVAVFVRGDIDTGVRVRTVWTTAVVSVIVLVVFSIVDEVIPHWIGNIVPSAPHLVSVGISFACIHPGKRFAEWLLHRAVNIVARLATRNH